MLPPHKLAEMGRIASAAPPGDFVEVGVFDGGSAKPLYEVCQRQRRWLYLFDTFAGIPHKSEWDVHGVGAMCFSDVDAIRAAMPLAAIYKGIFPATAEDVLFPAGIAFVHEDSDQYESTKSVIDRLYPHLVPGGIILFDDYDTPDCPGSRKAIDECGHQLHRAQSHVYIVKPDAA
jgi:O-methyltransferase